MATEVVRIKDKRYEKPITFLLNTKLRKALDSQKIALAKKDKDCFIVIDGMEGGGKSTFAFQVGKYVDNSLDISRVVFDAQSFKDAIFKAKKGQCIIFDEAFAGLSSRAALSGINKALVNVMMQMRQKNLFVIMVLPTFFLLDKYAALFRSKALLHVYECKGQRGYFKVYNNSKKKYLYLTGKNTYSYGKNGAKGYVYTKFKGRFHGTFALGDEKQEELYRKKKAKALEDTEKNPMSAGQVKYREQRNLLIYLLRKYSKLTYEEMSTLLGDYDLEISLPQIGNICSKFGDKPTIRTSSKKEDNSNEDNDFSPPPLQVVE